MASIPVAGSLAAPPRRAPRPAAAAAAADATDRGRSARRAAAAARRGLLAALAEQARRDTLPWVEDLVAPLLGAPPAPPAPPALPPRRLADGDSLFARIDGVDLHYKERRPAAPRPGAPAVLLLHGFNGSTFSFRRQLDALAAAGFHAVAVDRPPFGLSERPAAWGAGAAAAYNPYDLAGSARLHEALLAHLLGPNHAPVAVLGHSAGALVAMEMWRRAPRRVAALALVAPALAAPGARGPAPRSTLGGQLRLAAVRALLAADGPGLAYVRRTVLRRAGEVARGEGLDDIFPGGGDGDRAAPPAAQRQQQEVIDGYLKPLRAEGWDRGMLASFRAFSLPPAYDYAAVAAPVAVVLGTADATVPPEGTRALAAALRARERGAENTRLVELDCGHAPMEAVPDAFNAALLDFLESVSRYRPPEGGE